MRGLTILNQGTLEIKLKQYLKQACLKKNREQEFMIYAMIAMHVSIL